MTRLDRWDFLLLKTEHQLTETATRFDMHSALAEVTANASEVAYLDDGTGDYGVSGDALTKLTKGARS